MALELFDDTEFDSRTPEEWMELCLADEGATAKALIDGDRWELVRVLSYDAASGHYEVQAVAAAAPLRVPRIALLFVAEDPVVFAQRVAHAVHLRRTTISHLRAHVLFFFF